MEVYEGKLKTMENEEAKHSGVLGTVSECAGAGIGTVAKVGSIVKNSLTRPVDNLVLVTNEQTETYTPPKKRKIPRQEKMN